jgi:hypothetical protein
MKAYGDMEHGSTHSSTSAVDGGYWFMSRPLCPWEYALSTQWIWGGWTSETVWILWKINTPLAFTGNRNSSSRASSPQPSHYSTTHIKSMKSLNNITEAQSGWNLQFHPDCAWKRSSKPCMKLTSAEYTVENSWWWAEKMPETCRVL